jgi:hypothetical protein
MPELYGSAFSDVNIEDINTVKFNLNLTYKWTYVKTKPYILAIEKE